MDCASTARMLDINGIVGAVTAIAVAFTAFFTYRTHARVKKIPAHDDPV